MPESRDEATQQPVKLPWESMDEEVPRVEAEDGEAELRQAPALGGAAAAMPW